MSSQWESLRKTRSHSCSPPSQQNLLRQRPFSEPSGDDEVSPENSSWQWYRRSIEAVFLPAFKLEPCHQRLESERVRALRLEPLGFCLDDCRYFGLD